jgi:hypothetical protein
MDNLTVFEVWAMHCMTDILSGLTMTLISHPNVALLFDGVLLVGAGFALVAVVRVNIYLWKFSRVAYLLVSAVLAFVNPAWPDWSGITDFFVFAAFGIVLMMFYIARVIWRTKRRPHAQL